MGLFNNKPKASPVRRDQVRRLIKLGMEETDAADRDIESPEFRKAQARRDTEVGKSTKAELEAAHTALRRHGY
jgi:hypothetical protein